MARAIEVHDDNGDRISVVESNDGVDYHIIIYNGADSGILTLSKRQIKSLIKLMQKLVG